MSLENNSEKIIESMTGLTRSEINSIEINKTSSGYSWKIKMYCEPEKEVDTIAKLKNVDTKLRETFGVK